MNQTKSNADLNHWFWEWQAKGCLTVLVGHSGIGKTAIALDLAAKERYSNVVISAEETVVSRSIKMAVSALSEMRQAADYDIVSSNAQSISTAKIDWKNK